MLDFADGRRPADGEKIAGEPFQAADPTPRKKAVAALALAAVSRASRGEPSTCGFDPRVAFGRPNCRLQRHAAGTGAGRGCRTLASARQLAVCAIGYEHRAPLMAKPG
jgi:hypothetical protein